MERYRSAAAALLYTVRSGARSRFFNVEVLCRILERMKGGVPTGTIPRSSLRVLCARLVAPVKFRVRTGRSHTVVERR